MSAAMRWFDSAGVGMISCGLSCFRAMPAKKPATAEPRMMPGAASEASNAAAALHKTSTHAVSLLGGGAILGAFDVREVDNPTNETRRAGTATSPEADDREGLSPWRGSSKAPSPKKTASPQQVVCTPHHAQCNDGWRKPRDRHACFRTLHWVEDCMLMARRRRGESESICVRRD